jgi:hypothetical protein
LPGNTSLKQAGRAQFVAARVGLAALRQLPFVIFGFLLAQPIAFGQG